MKLDHVILQCHRNNHTAFAASGVDSSLHMVEGESCLPADRVAQKRHAETHDLIRINIRCNLRKHFLHDLHERRNSCGLCLREHLLHNHALSGSSPEVIASAVTDTGI